VLRIRAAQMEALRQYMFDQFVRETVRQLWQSFPDETASMEEDDIKAFVFRGIENAGRYGISDSENVLRYIECSMAYGEDFDVAPETDWAGSILRREGLSPDTRMDLIDWHEFAASEAD